LHHPELLNALFHHQYFLYEIGKLEDRYGRFFGQMELELTEEIVMENGNYSARILQNLKKMGFRLSIDDFGTGYSSLSQLKKMDADKIKIDRSFITDIAENDQDRIIVKAVIVMGHAMGLTVLAEGVENPMQLELLKKMGCDAVQGYHLGRPVPIEAFVEEWLTEPRSR